MRRWYSVGLLLFLVLVFLPSGADAQQKGGGSARDRLGQNYPNPFNPETRIPYRLEEGLFEGGSRVEVTIRIFNVLQQLVAIPVALNYPAGGAPPVNRLEYATPGEYIAYWDGYDRNGRKVASGIYYMQLVVNGESTVRKMVVGK